MTTLEAAQKYVNMGYSVIPLYHPSNDPSPEGKKGKKPKVPWKEYQSRKATEIELAQWFGNGLANIGIVTGRVSGIDVIDCDSEEAVLQAAKNGLPDCPKVKTKKGYHFYYKNTGNGNFQKRDDLVGIDFRGEGGYVVAPPSVHESGHVYTWIGLDRDKLDCPTWIFHTEESKQQTRKPFAQNYSGAREGDRNQTLARLCGVWAIHLSFNEMMEAAQTWNANNNPPMNEYELQTTVKSIYSKEQSKKQNTATESEIITIQSLYDRLRVVYETGLQRGESTGWKCLDEFYTVRRGEWTLVTGIPAAGKTEFLDHLAVNLSTKGWKFGLFSAENLPHERHLVSLIEKYLNKPFSKGPSTRATKEEVAMALKYLQERFSFIAPNENNMTIDRILELGKGLVDTFGITGMIVDPWNELDHSRPPNMTETENISSCLTRVRRFARTYKVHVWVVAHPTKLTKKDDGTYPVPTPYDVSGSAHWRNKADNAISLWRNAMVPEEPTEIHVQKIRFREVGKIGITNLKYDVITGRFNDVTPERERGIFDA